MGISRFHIIWLVLQICKDTIMLTSRQEVRFRQTLFQNGVKKCLVLVQTFLITLDGLTAPWTWQIWNKTTTKTQFSTECIVYSCSEIWALRLQRRGGSGEPHWLPDSWWMTDKTGERGDGPLWTVSEEPLSREKSWETTVTYGVSDCVRKKGILQSFDNVSPVLI